MTDARLLPTRSARAVALAAVVVAVVLGASWIGPATGWPAGAEVVDESDDAATDDPAEAGADGATTADTGPIVLDPPIATAVDARTDQIEISLLGTGPADVRRSVSVVEGGNDVEVSGVRSARAADEAMEVVIVIDANARGARGEVLDRIAAELASQIRQLPSATSVAVVSAGNSALVLTDLTTDHEEAATALEELTVKSGSVLYNGIDRAASLLGSEPGVARSVIVVSTGADTGSSVLASEAAVQVIRQGGQVISLAYQGGDPGLDQAVDQTAGATVDIADTTSIEAVTGRAFDLATDRTTITFTSVDESGARTNVEVVIGDLTAVLSYPPGVLTTNPVQLVAIPEPTEPALGFLTTSTALYVALGLAFVGITLGVWSLASILSGTEQTSLEGMLSRYAESPDSFADDEVEELLVQSALLQRAVSFSESFAAKRGFLVRVEEMLEKANLPVRPGEAMFMMAAVTVLSAAFGLVLTRSLLVSVVIGAGTVGLLFFAVRFMGRRRFKTFEAQLPDTLQLLAGTLRAGYSLPQGLDAVSKEIADPMGQELGRAMTEARLGSDLEEALNGVAERMDSADFAWAVMAINIQREVGGNLNELLLSVSETMIARERLKREVSALTAEGRMSAGILSFLPPGLGLVMWVMNPDYVSLLFTSLMGNILLGLGTFSALVGLAWMKKVITIDV